MKRQLSLVLALVMILGTFTSVFAADTVTTVDAIEEASKFLESKNVLEGNEKGDLMLDKNLLRQDTVVLVAKLMGEYDVAKDFPTAEDIPTYEDIRDPFYLPLLAWAQANETFVGQSEKEFGFGDDLTAQEYAKVLLVALGHTVGPNGDEDVKWSEALETAKTLGILENIEVANADKLVRGKMAVMTFNALSVKMKDSDKTLAEKLGIEMPTPAEATELTAVVNDTKNLKEVVLELSNVKLVDMDKLENRSNYRVEKIGVEKVTVDGNDVILLLDEALVKDRTYELSVRGIDRAIDKTYKFKAKDNESPKVEKVTVLGEYGIKVTVSEPVDNPEERNFLVDGKNVAMDLETYGRDIILTPYHNTSFPANAKTLTIKELEDFEGYKSAREDFDIEIVNDDVAPKVTDVTVDGKVVTVTFDKDIYKESVSGYENSRNEGNVYYRSGRHDVFSRQHKDGDYGKKIDTNKAEYVFEENLPKNTDLVITGVQNHSKVTMERTNMVARELKDNLEPIIAKYDVDEKLYTETDRAGSDQYKEIKVAGQDDLRRGYAEITLEFDKAMKFPGVDTSKTANYNTKDASVLKSYQLGEGYLELYNEKVLNRYKKSNDEKVTEVRFEDYDSKDKAFKTVVIFIDGLVENDNDKRFDYILEVKKFEDKNGNEMYTDYVEFELDAEDIFKLEGTKDHDGIVTKYDPRKEELEIDIYFTEPVDRVRAEDKTNYLFTKNSATDTKVYDLGDIDSEIIVDRDGERVTLILKDVKEDDYKTLQLSRALRDKDNNRLDQGSAVVIQLLDGNKLIKYPVVGAVVVDKVAEARVAKNKVIDEVVLTAEDKAGKTAESVVAAEAKLAELKKAAKDAVAAAKTVEAVNAVPAVDKKVATDLLVNKDNGDVTATYAEETDLLGVKSYSVTLTGAESEDVKEVQITTAKEGVTDKVIDIEIVDGVVRFNSGDGAVTGLKVVLKNGVIVQATK